MLPGRANLPLSLRPVRDCRRPTCLWPWRRHLAALDGERSPYMTIPTGFWSQDGCRICPPPPSQSCSRRTSTSAATTVPRYLLRDRRESYGLFHDTRTRGPHELQDSGLLTAG